METQSIEEKTQSKKKKVQQSSDYEPELSQRYSLRTRTNQPKKIEPPKRKRATTKKESKEKEIKEGKKEEESEAPKKKKTTKEKKEKKEKEEEKIPDILEKGQIYFLYRPKVEKSEVHSMDEVSHFFVLLQPYHHNMKRLLVIGNKHLPHPTRHEKGFAVVEMVSEHISEIDQKHFEFDTYETKTRGLRHEFPARPIGEGLYAIFEHHGVMRLAYALEIPETPGQVQKAFDIKDEGSFIFSVKNPSVNETARRKDFPHDVLEKLGGKEGTRWARVVPPDVLDHEGIEMFIVGAHHHLDEEMGLELTSKFEEEAHEVAASLTVSSVLQHLRMTKKDHPVRPLSLGKWA